MRALSSIHRLLPLVLLLCLGCSRASDRPATRAQLRQAFERAPLIEIQVADGPGRGSVHLDAAWRAADVLSQRSGKQFVVTEQVDGGSLDVPRIVIGTRLDPGMAALGAMLGGEAFEQETSDGGAASGRWTVQREDPERAGRPLVLHVADGWGSLLPGLENLAPMFAPGESRVSQRMGRSATPFELREAVSSNQRLDGRGVHLRMTEEVDVQRAGRYHASVLRVIEHVEAWYGAPLDQRVDLQISASPEQFRQLDGRSGLSGLDDLPAARLVLLAPGMADDGAACVARWAASRLLGPTEHNWVLDGAALDAAGSWWGQELVAWGQWLASNELLPGVVELVDNTSVDRLSQHQLAPARGLLFRYLREEHDGAYLRSLWEGREETKLSGALDKAFRSWLLASSATPVERTPFNPAKLDFQTGVSLASNAGPGGGFDGRSLPASLTEARELGANSLSITSFFAERPALSGARIPSGRECLEGDVALAFAVAEARAAGLERVTLQTHLLLTPSAGYSAWQRRTNEVHWTAFFDQLDPALVHYGLLAQLTGVDVLCIGTRLSTASANAGLEPPVKALHDQRLGQAIDLARAAFSGALTYAADSNGEAENFEHWERLDYLGASIFWRGKSVGEQSMSSGAMRARWNSTLEKLESLSAQRGKPLLILEAGVRSVSGGRSETRVGTGPLDLAQQAHYWEALADTLVTRRAQGQSALSNFAGVYAWKWGPSPSSGGHRDRGFQLQGKPAALQLKRLSSTD